MTEREQIEQKIAENERKIAEGERKQAELQRNMIEQERNMARQIKDFLEKGIPKADIAKATEFSIEYIDSLLEKFYPQTAAEEQIVTSKENIKQQDDSKDQEIVINYLKHQVQNLQNRLDNKELEIKSLKQQLQALQKNRINTVTERIETTQGIQQWEYKNGSWKEEELNKLGEEGWEVVSLSEYRTVLKRPKKCIYCNGTGIRNWIDIYDNKVKKKCDKCNGTGKILL